MVWTSAFEGFAGHPSTWRALALGFPVQGRGVRLHLEGMERRGPVTEAFGTRSRAVVVLLRAEWPDGVDPRPVVIRVGRWPEEEDGALLMDGERLRVPAADAEAWAVTLAPGALAETLGLNLERQRSEGLDPEGLGLGLERLLDGVWDRIRGSAGSPV